MTVLLGPTPCHVCHEPVTVVRRPVVITGHADGCGRHHDDPCAWAESTEMRETRVIGADLSVHRCPDVAIARAFDYTTGAGASGQSNTLNVAPVYQLAPGVRASFHVGSKTT